MPCIAGYLLPIHILKKKLSFVTRIIIILHNINTTCIIVLFFTGYTIIFTKWSTGINIFRIPFKTPLLNLPVAGVVFLATAMDGDVSRRFDNVCDSETVVHGRSAAFPSIAVVVAVVGNGTALTPVPRYVVVSANESKTFLVVACLFFLTSSSSSSLNNKPAERDVRCCVLCRLKSWRLDTFGPPLSCNDGSYDVTSALLFGRRPSQSSVVVFLVAVNDVGLRVSFLRTYVNKWMQITKVVSDGSIEYFILFSCIRSRIYLAVKKHPYVPIFL